MSDKCEIENVNDVLTIMPRTTFSLRQPLPRVFESKNPSYPKILYALSLQIEDSPRGVGQEIAILGERHDLLEMARHIVHALDPSPQDQILDEMRTIRNLLEDQG